MSETAEIQLEVLTEHLAELCFIKHDFTGMLRYLAKNVIWFDMKQNKIYKNKDDIIAIFEKDNLHENLAMEEATFQCLQVNDKTGIVMAKMRIYSYELVSQMIDIYPVFSFVWEKKEHSQWEVIYIHQSILDKKIQQETYLNIDNMTNINSLEGFVKSVQKILNEKTTQRYAMIKFGIRDFRYINQRHGYKTGDRILKNIAKNLLETCDQDETCGRIEKDTFAMLYKYKSKTQIAKRMESVRLRLLDDNILFDLGMDVNFIAGIYIVPKNSTEHVKDMLDKALLAMQNLGHHLQESHYLYYEKWMMEKQYLNRQIIEDAPAAIENEEFQLYIQPQFDVKTGKPVAGEALCRWEKNGNLILPHDFIPLFEDYGFILSFDFYMLKKLCQKIKSWIDQGSSITPISINQSRLHIENKNYIKDFCKIVDAYEIPHRYIAFELTESAFIEQNEKMILLAKELHEKGFQLAIDDFGTGFASLNLLSIISADILKVDKSLVDSMQTKRGRAVLQKVIELAHQMEMDVICEGVEQMEQFELLKELGCDMIQGFLLGKPIPASEFEKIWIDSHGK